MKTTEFVDRILQRLGFEPTQDQLAATRMFAAFLADRAPESAMVMRGSAGTGKTTLASAMVDTLHSLGQPIVLMAPTGRAAKVFAVNSHLPAATIHRTIYRERSVAPDSQFNLNFNRSRRTLFVVDEASMISGRSSADRTFGTGNLLDDLIKFVYSGDQCRLLLIGDSAQLPPVGEQEAPALSPDELGAYGLKVYACDLGEVVRQGKTSGILLNATQLRLSMPSWEEQMTNPILPKLRVKGLADVVRVPGNELIEQLASSYSEVGVDETIVVTRSNKRATIYNQGIRARVLDLDDVLCGADRVMVVKNKYLSNTDGALRTTRQLSFIANGDRCEVRRVRHFRELYGFHFADATLRFPDYDGQELQSIVMLDALGSDAPALTREQQDQLYNRVMEDYSDLPLKGDRMRAVRDNPYYNALQIKFAYAVTCHKAQGGQWEHVYIDQGYMTADMLTPDYFHWLYTAVTRARTRLFLVNWPEEQVSS
ncbi:MAG: AAA family ATPase [Prevotella sp.]|jgi:tRNA A37 threonylcarbamoyladenosine biosynthesis protein TsaE|nr:AAA family ATPase [Prevotella sp.]